MKPTLQLFLLILCGAFCMRSHAQTCTGEVLNISASDPSTSGTKQSWQVPAGGIYRVRITARGAAGGSKLISPAKDAGKGAWISGDFFVASGQVLQAIAGARGQSANQAGGGGGGSGVQIQSSGLLLLLAGGGGGAGADVSSGEGGGAPITNAGTNGGSASNGGGGGGGFGGNGQNSSNSFSGGGGGGGYDGTGGFASTNNINVGFGGGGFGAGGGGGSICSTISSCSGTGFYYGGGGGGGYSGGNAGIGSVSNFGSGGIGGGSYNIGTNQSNFPNANASGGQVIIQCLGTAAFSAIVTPTIPNCGSNQGSVNIDLTGDLNGFPNDVVEYAIVSGTSFSGNPTFTSIAAEPFDVTNGTGTTPGTYTVRIRLKYNPDLFTDQTYTIGARNATAYVNVNVTGGANNGSSWENAFVSLQDALISTCPGGQIWVAAGTYKPHASDRNASFVMVRDVAIYGGFNGTETQLSARNWTTNETILSGEIGEVGSVDNIYLIIKNVNNDLTPSNSLLDGFTITGANNMAALNGSDNGGGMYNNNSSPSINNCKFLSNRATFGAGMYNQNASPRLSNCTFLNNLAFEHGAGMYNRDNSNPTLTNVSFLTNWANNDAGGIYNQNSSPTLENCIFSGNSGRKGGGMYNRDNSNPDLRGVSFKGNRAAYGGGMDNESSSSPKLTNCIFSGNYGDNFGGGMRNTNSSPILTNVTFSGNWAVTNYGGIANYSSNPVFKNCILWGNSSGVYNDANSTSSYTYCLIQGLNPAGTGNLDGTLSRNNPLFISQPDFTAAPTTTGDLRLLQCSPAIDAGTATDAPTTDLDGNSRVDAHLGGGIVDMGAYEFQLTDVWGRVYVNASASGRNNGSSWADAFTDLQSALSLARANPSCISQIWVAAGTYKPTTGTERFKNFRMVSGVAIYGGFSGGETQLSQRNWATNVTTLSGDIGEANKSEDNSYHVVYGTTTSYVLDGFTITGGNADDPSGVVNNKGGGMYNETYDLSSAVTISNCRFVGNQAGNGGGMYSDAGVTKLTNCVFVGNTATKGGGMYNGSVTASPNLVNCVFLGNTATYGGGTYEYAALTTMTNVTLSGNQATLGGGMYFANYPIPNPRALTNCILWGNSSGIFIDNSYDPITYSHCLIQGLNPPGTGNLDGTLATNNPRFVSPPAIGLGTTGDLRLQQCSPAIDAGTSTDAPTTDLDGSNRVDAVLGGGTVDIGAYEHQSTYDICSCISNNGIVYVNASASGSNSGRSWADAFTDLQSALSVARANPSCVSQIWVAAGTYKPTSGTNQGISFSMVSGVAIYGGFPTTGSPTMANRNWTANSTILSGDIGEQGVNTDNSYRVIYNTNNTDNTALLDGFTITAGSAVVGGSKEGGGVFNDGSNGFCHPTFSNCIFRNNRANTGGAVYIRAENGSSQPSFINCLFYQNQTIGDITSYGGAMSFQGNVQLTLLQCTFANNSSQTAGGAIYSVSNFGSPVVTAKNCIFWGNSASNGSQIYLFASTLTISHTVLQGGISGVASTANSTINNNGNVLESNPLFVNAANGDFHLQQCSPAINAGDPATTSATVGSLDLGGNPRFYNNGRIDIGAYEYQGTFDAVAPVAQVTNSTCTTVGGIPSGGVISAPSGSCPAGSSLYYSTDNGSNWSTTVPTYAQSGPAQTILTRCACDANPASFGPTSTVTTVPGTCPTCPDLTIAAPAVQVTNSVCTTFNGTASGGVISAPSGSCPAGSTLQYSTDNGGNWSTTLLTYEQTGPAQTILTRCTCGANSSPTSTVTTVPGTCPTCPDLTVTAAPAVQVTNSVCTTFNGTASGGVISAPSGSCPAGSTLQYSTDNGGNWSTTLPTYAQTGPAQTILTRCNCGANSSPTSTVTTVPGTCPVCPDLTAAAPAVQVTNSVCTTFNGTASGGSIIAPSGSCPAGSTLQYSTDNGGSWSGTLPTYAQTGPAQTILTRCNCTADATNSSPTSTVTTVPGTCPTCPDLTAAAPAVQVTNSVCTTFNGTASGGSIIAPSGSCPAGSTLQYSTDNGGSWSGTLPTYAQTGPAQTILTRCNCTADATKSSPTSTVTTVPGTCPVCPDLTAAAPAVQVTNSVCTTFNGTASGGSISAPSGSCPAGSTLQYSTDNGGNWSTTLPTYAQTGPAQTILTRCNCTADVTKSSPTSTVTTVPGTCPVCPDLTAAAPAVQVTNSVCTTFNGTASGGVISAPSGSCPAGSTLQYSTDNGGNWSGTLPTYAQTGPAQTILTRCNCTADATISSPTSTVTTAPGTCPVCPDLTAAAPAVQVTNSVCTTFNGTASGGVISAPSGSCPAGSTLQYSTDNGGNWSTTLPTYAQTGPAQTILTRCNCTADVTKSSPTSTVKTVPGTCPVCPDLTAAAPAVQVTNSVCTTFGGTASGGVIIAPSGSCPAGSTLQYSTDNGGNWSTTLPTYAQTGPVQSILTRCNCTADASTSSPTSTVTTVPGTCPACPVLTTAAPAVQVTNSVCTTYGGMASGGVISAPIGSCPAGSTLQYSTDNGGNWSGTLPTYAQTGPAQTILTRCNCTADATKSSPTSTVTTVPGTCPVCPDLTAAAPAVQVTNSVCTTFGGTASGGSIIAPSGSCPAGSTLQYSTDNGGNWSTTLPTYAQTGPVQTILTRCNCTADVTKSSPTSTVTTVPGTCPVCPDLTAAAPAVQVTNSVCTTYGGMTSGGVIIAPSSSCPAGSILQYSTDNGGNWSTTLPIYAQTGPAQTILTRCNCTADVTKSSPTSTVTTAPGTCPVCPVLTAIAPAVQVTNSVCQAGCIIGGGSISAPSGSCPAGSTLQYQLNNGGWSTTLPTYAQTGPAQTIKTRCVCNADASQVSPESSVTTIPGTVPSLVVPANGSAVVSCPALAIAPTLPVVNDCNGNPLTPSASVITNSPDPLTCEGTRTYTYSYECGSATASWSFVYTIEREPFTISVANGSATVYDPALAVAPTPPTVMSSCGEVLSPSAPVITNSPNPLLCEGTRTYSYTYTDCEGNTATWSFVYTVLDNIAPTISCPANVVGCAGQTITFTPPVGTDNCLGAVTTQIAGLPTGSVFPLGVTTNTFRVMASNGQTAECSFTVTIQGKPTITLSTLQQTLNEGNAQVFCDTDANPVNGLQFTVSGSCVVGNPVWRVQVGSGAWSDWSPNAPVSQLSNNQPHRYQAACDASCPVTYTNPIELTINYRSSTPQNVSLVADGVSVNVGETKEVCNIEGNAITFNATCGLGEILLYSVDGAEYSSTLPVQLVDGQYHNYRVRCRKSDGTVSCVESESGVMRLRIVSSSLVAPVASLNVTSGCGSPVTFSGTANCGALTTIWYNAVTNVALPSLPSQTPTETTSYYARCQAGGGCLSEKSNVVTYTVIPVGVAPAITASQDIVCTGTTVKISANCPAGSQAFWNTGVTASSFEVSFGNVTKQTYWAKCLFEGGCQSTESVRKDVYWNAFVVTLVNVGQTKSAIKTNDRAAWSSQFITRDGGPELEQSTQVNPTLYFVENANKMAPRYWTINVEACGLSTDGSLTFDMLATPEMGVIRSFNTHENNAPYFMYANREGWTELYAQNHPAYGFYQDNGAGGNVYDAGLPKGLYKLGIRYWDQKGWGSIYPSTRKPQGNVLAYQEYWFRIQSKDGVGVGAARTAEQVANGKGQGASVQEARGEGQRVFANVMPNPVTNILRLKVQESKGQVVQAALMDAAGREVLSRQFIPETNTHQEEFGVSALPTGMYFLKVSTAIQQVTLKVVKVE